MYSVYFIPIVCIVCLFFYKVAIFFFLLKLSSLKKGEGLRKESDDTSIIANTYDPDAEIKNEKSNRRKQRRIEESGEYHSQPGS